MKSISVGSHPVVANRKSPRSAIRILANGLAVVLGLAAVVVIAPTPAGASLMSTGTMSTGASMMAPISILNPQLITPGSGPQTIRNLTVLPSTPVNTGSTYGLEAYGGQSGNPVLFSVDQTSGRSTCFVNPETQLPQTNIFEDVITFTSPGSCIIDENQAGSATYSAAPQVQIRFTVVIPGLHPQVITNLGKLPTAPVKVWGTYGLEAFGGQSGSPVLFSVDQASSRSACFVNPETQLPQTSIFEDVISFTGSGTCIIDENQAGSPTYSAAPQVQIRFTVS